MAVSRCAGDHRYRVGMRRTLPLSRGTFHPETAEMVGPDGVIRLTVAEARLLSYLAERAGQFVDVETLQREVWGYAPGVQSRTAYVTLGRLRAKIEADPQNPRHLMASRQRGYRFVPLADEADSEAEMLLARLTALGYRVAISRVA